MKKVILLIIPLFIMFLTIASCAKVKSEVLIDSWAFYKNKYINNDGRVIDFQRDSITTSEGQSYAMLRAVLVNDQKTFDLVYQWSKNNLKRDNDRLFAWLWGQTKDNGWGIIYKNAASDADIDIAFALILANKQWKDKSYLTEAKEVINDIWNLETKVINGQRVLISGVEQGKSEKIDINPSYFAPYAFRIFGKYDKSHNWKELVNSSYDLLNRVTLETKTGLPPNWFYMDAVSGKITFDEASSLKNDFSYDAIRVFARIYIDYVYSKDKRALNILEKSRFFIEKYPEPEKDFIFYTNFKNDGSIRDNDENIGAISVLIPVFNLYDKNYATALYSSKVMKNYNAKGYWADQDNYYTQNLSWLGTWMYLNEKK
ncbi:MAG TPA: glycosyl hydrolase family 8 [Candidatus Gastranaerophilales bacterium]|nr:glycosyl hydrolase family 8 [Candidatus Gastranaerophilales bacterium]